MTVIRVLAQTHIGYDIKIGYLVFESTCRFLNDAVFGISAGCKGIFLVRYSKKHYSRNTKFTCFFRGFQKIVYGQLKVSGHGIDWIVNPFAGNGKKREDQVIYRESGFANHPAKRIILPQPSWSVVGEKHSSSYFM